MISVLRRARPASVLPRLLLSFCMLCLALAWSQRAHAGATGLWMSGGDYLVLMQDVNHGTVVGLQVPPSYAPLTVWIGSVTANGISLSSPIGPDTLTAAYVGESLLTGTTVQGGVSKSFNAFRAFGHQATPYDGVWQKAGANNDYLVYLTLALSSGTLPIQFDVTINPNQSYSYNLFTGSYNAGSATFTGVSMLAPSLASRLVFSGSGLSGSYISTGQPPSVHNFSASQIIKLAN